MQAQRQNLSSNLLPNLHRNSFMSRHFVVFDLLRSWLPMKAISTINKGAQMTKFRTLDQAVEFYEIIQSVRASGELRDQLHRAASSIALNLSEGNAKSSANDKKAYFQRSYGSLRECQTILRLLKVESSNVHQSADKLAASLYKLVNSEIKNSPNWHKN